jgi:hypothetical protein
LIYGAAEGSRLEDGKHAAQCTEADAEGQPEPVTASFPEQPPVE